MSSRAIKEHSFDKSWMRIFACCQPQLIVGGPQLLTQGEGEMMDCNICAIACPIDVFGGAFDNIGAQLSSGNVTNAGTMNLASINIAQNAVVELQAKVYALNNSADITGIAFAGDTASVPPAVPITIPQGGVQAINAVLDTAVLGAFNVMMTIATPCGAVVINQPYNVV